MSLSKIERDADFAARLADLSAAAARAAALVASSRELLTRLRPARRTTSETNGAPAEPQRVPTGVAFDEFASRLSTAGIRDALAYLLGLSDYRFIGIFRFEAGMANAAVHVDRENFSQLSAQEVPDTATYCCYVRDSGGAFATAHATLDPRLGEHPARDSVQAYCGVPIMTPEGEILGTLCHYDLVPRDPENLDLPLLLQVASTLAQSGLVPPYPRA